MHCRNSQQFRISKYPAAAGLFNCIIIQTEYEIIVPGIKVALTGINCTDYIALDMAIGLCGAVSVPIYYTAPAEEINLLLEKSGSEWFFIGDKRIMSLISGIHTTAKTVGFGVVADAEKGKTDFTWSAFLGSAKQVYTAVAVETVIV